MTAADPLAGLFAEVWEAFLDGAAIDGFDLQKLVEKTGLALWRPATANDVARSHLDLEVGDPILCLTEEGRLIVRQGRGEPEAGP